MHISNRTLIEVASAGVAVALIADAYSKNIAQRKLLLKSRDLFMYFADVLDREKTPMTQFDAIAIQTLIDS